MTIAAASTMSSAATRRLHYQTQQAHVSTQNLSMGDTSHTNDSFSLSHTSGNPLITIIYTKGSLSQGMLIIRMSQNSMRA